MRAKLGWGLVWGAIVVSCLIGQSRKATAANCALYARGVTGVDLFGAAGGWWDQAAGLYGRGQSPAVGSILVFRRTGRIPSGHVAVVSRVISPTEILVDHANWYRGTVSHDMPVVDTSPNHDWTMVAVLQSASGQFGSDYPTYGFVYPQSGPRALVASVDTAGFDPNARTPAGSRGRSGRFDFAIDEEYYAAISRRHAHRRGARHSSRFAAGEHARVHARSHPGAFHTRHVPSHPAGSSTAGLYRPRNRAT